MRTAMRGLAVVAALAMSLGMVTGADGKRTLTGSYNWSDTGKIGDLEAVFTPTGERTWDVAFHFVFDGRSHIYSGTAEGTLAGGDLKGRVFNEARNRTFVFTGAFADGGFQGTHAEISKNGEHPTGTLTLRG